VFHHDSKSRHHRRIIDQEGNSLEDTRPLGRLWFARPQLHEEQPAATDRTSPTRILPVHGDRTIAMRIPSPPQEPVKSFPRSFFEIPEFVSQVTQVQVGVHHRAAEMRRKFDVRMQGLLRHAREASAQWRYAGTAGLGHDLAAAYAEGGTERLLALTPSVLAEMDARAKAGSAVAA
jgi:hypothetical protein